MSRVEEEACVIDKVPFLYKEKHIFCTFFCFLCNYIYFCAVLIKGKGIWNEFQHEEITKRNF